MEHKRRETVLLTRFELAQNKVNTEEELEKRTSKVAMNQMSNTAIAIQLHLRTETETFEVTN